MRFTRYILTAVLAVLFALPVAKDGNQFVAVEVEYDAPSMLSEASEEIAEVERIAKADNIINTALKYLGVKYSYGQSSPKGFDCSGFTKYVFNEEHITLTRNSRSQYNQGERVAKLKDLRPGDLVFFGGEHSPRSVGHVGIVVEVDEETGRFTFVHASRTGIKVDLSSEKYYSSRYLGARRVIL
jgi:cell wall-associated NlpC family hydrolase